MPLLKVTRESLPGPSEVHLALLAGRRRRAVQQDLGLHPEHVRPAIWEPEGQPQEHVGAPRSEPVGEPEALKNDGDLAAVLQDLVIRPALVQITLIAFSQHGQAESTQER